MCFGFGFLEVGTRGQLVICPYSIPQIALIGQKKKMFFPDFGRKEEGRKEKIRYKRDGMRRTAN
jgi:hypothetical protein